MNKKLTMKDIADLSGVAKSTISRYFNGGYVKDQTKEKIKKIIDEYNYQPNAFAQSLKAKQSKIIGVIAPCLDSTVSSRIMMSIDEHLREEGYTSLFINTNHTPKLELENLENLWRMNVDGIILIATQISEQHKEMIRNMDIPVLVVGQGFEGNACLINDDYMAGYTVGKYAVEMGHRNILYMGIDEADKAVGIERKRGILEGCATETTAHVEVWTTDFNFQTSHNLAFEKLSSPLPDLIICATDRIALGVFKTLQEKNIKVPDDISLIGFGGYEISSLISPKLTTIRFENAEAGRIAATTLLSMIQKEEVELLQVIRYTLIQGESVKAL